MKDAELVTLAIEADAEAFAELLRRHEKVMYGVITKMLGGSKKTRDEGREIGIESGGGTLEAKDDVWQNACLDAYLALPKFRGDASFKTWLGKIVERKALDELKARSRRPESIWVRGQESDDDAADEWVQREVEDNSGDPSLLLDADEALAEAERSLPSDEYTAVPIAKPSIAAMMYLAALAWPELDAHENRDRCLWAMAHLAERKGREFGFDSPNRMTMPLQQQDGTLRLMCKRLDYRLRAARVSMYVMAGFKRPDGMPWTEGAAASESGKRTSWHRDVWAATLPVLHLAWKFRGVADFKRRYLAVDSDAILDLILDASWVADALTGAETLANVLPRAVRKGDRIPYLELPPLVRLIPE